jgi:hypothetical protein
MDSNYRPQSPDLSSYAPQSPDLSGFQPPDPNLPTSHTASHYSGFGQNPAFSSNQNPGYGQSASVAAGFQGSAYPGNNANSIHTNGFASHYTLGAPTSIPQLPEPAYQQQMQQQAYHQQQQQQQQQQYIPPGMMAGQQQYQPFPQQQQSHYQQPQFFKNEDNDPDYNPHAAPAATPNKRSRRTKQEPSYNMPGNSGFDAQSSYAMNRPGMPAVKSEPLPDPTLGCQLRTTFPVARIKRLMQADEDIGKVAQVTPTVVSRALELFMIKLISASAMQARGGAIAAPTAAALGEAKAGAAGTPAAAPPSGSGPKRILVQHLKKAVLADETFDFLREIVDKVPDAPAKGKREGGGGGGGAGGGAGSDSEDGGAATKAKKRGRRRKDSGDDF